MSQPRPAPPAFRLEQIIGLSIALGGAALIVWVRTVALAAVPMFEQRLVSTVAFWGLAILVLIWIAIAEQRPLSSIGLGRPTLNGAGWGLGAGVAITALLISAGWLIDQLHLPMPQTESADPSSLPLAMRAVMVVTSGFAEELLFVAYPVSRLLEITRSRWIAGLVPAVIFVLIHVPGRSPEAVLNAAFGAALLIGLFLWRRNLWTNIIAHTVVDLTPLLIIPAVMQALH